MAETPEVRLRRLRMRSWRRGMKEMDLILGRFADDRLASLPVELLADYESLLSENDQDLYLWITGRVTAARPAGDGPEPLSEILDDIARHAADRARNA